VKGTLNVTWIKDTSTRVKGTLNVTWKKILPQAVDNYDV